MAIKKQVKDLYDGYFQKSRVFLYSSLGIKKTSIAPLQTYVSWEDKIQLNDQKLITCFHLRDDSEFVNFEENVIFKNQYFDSMEIIENNKILYIFDLSTESKNWDHFINGRYSQLDNFHKNAIRKFYGSDSINYAYIDTYLHPENYYDLYAKFLCPDQQDIPNMIKILKSVTELCDKPNLGLEHLKSINVLDLKKV